MQNPKWAQILGYLFMFWFFFLLPATTESSYASHSLGAWYPLLFAETVCEGVYQKEPSEMWVGLLIWQLISLMIIFFSFIAVKFGFQGTYEYVVVLMKKI